MRRDEQNVKSEDGDRNETESIAMKQYLVVNNIKFDSTFINKRLTRAINLIDMKQSQGCRTPFSSFSKRTAICYPIVNLPMDMQRELLYRMIFMAYQLTRGGARSKILPTVRLLWRLQWSEVDALLEYNPRRLVKLEHRMSHRPACISPNHTHWLKELSNKLRLSIYLEIL